MSDMKELPDYPKAGGDRNTNKLSEVELDPRR